MADVIIDTESKNPKELLGQGIKAYILQDYTSSVQALSKASELLAEEHGDGQHESLGEVYLYYGKALLALSRDESDALGDAVPKNEDDSDDTQDEDNVDEGNDIENDENVDNEKKEETEIKPSGSSKEKEVNDGESNEVDEETTEEKGEEEPTDLQVAWEVLELAKNIFQKKGQEGIKQLADTLIILGEISLESENFESAVNDIKQGVEIQKKVFGNDSRTIAESLYKLGIAYSTTSQIEEAIDCFNESLQYLTNRINILEKSEDKKDSVDEEIGEIKTLIPEIQEKIADMKNFKEEAIKNLASALSEPSTQGSGSSSSKQASDISHLVKRKRKSDEHTVDKDIEKGAAPAKKPSP